MTDARYAYPAGFVLACAAVLAASAVVAGQLPQATRPGVVATGLTLDLAVVLPALYYTLLVRGRGWPMRGTVLVFGAGLGVAAWLLPVDHRGALSVLGRAAPVLEVLVTGYVVVRAARIIRRRWPGGTAGDVLTRWRTAAREAFPVRALAEVVAYEAALWHYLAQGLRRAGWPESHASNFFYHTGYGPVVAALLMVSGAELVAGHVLLQLWHPAAAWVHFALACYGLCWFTADYFAACRRPMHVGRDALTVRLGLRWTAHVPLGQIASVKATRTAPGEALAVTLLGGANVLVTLRAPIEATGPYGLTRRAEALHLKVDEPERLAERLRALLQFEDDAL